MISEHIKMLTTTIKIKPLTEARKRKIKLQTKMLKVNPRSKEVPEQVIKMSSCSLSTTSHKITQKGLNFNINYAGWLEFEALEAPFKTTGLATET